MNFEFFFKNISWIKIYNFGYMFLGSIINHNKVIMKYKKMKVKVLFIGGIRVHGLRSYLCFLGTMFSKLF